MNEEVRSTLRRMKEVLINEGWVRGDYQNENGVCLSGALGRALGYNDLHEGWSYKKEHLATFMDVQTALFHALPVPYQAMTALRAVDAYGCCIVKYNDSRKDVSEVIALIDQALEMLPVQLELGSEEVVRDERELATVLS